MIEAIHQKKLTEKQDILLKIKARLQTNKNVHHIVNGIFTCSKKIDIFFYFLYKFNKFAWPTMGNFHIEQEQTNKVTIDEQPTLIFSDIVICYIKRCIHHLIIVNFHILYITSHQIKLITLTHLEYANKGHKTSGGRLFMPITCRQKSFVLIFKKYLT